LVQNNHVLSTGFQSADNLARRKKFAVHLLFQYKKHLSNMTSSVDRAFYSWIFVFIMIHAIPVIAAMISFVFTDHGNYTMLILLLGFFIFSFAVYIAIIVKPELFHSFPHQMLIPESTEEKTQKYESSNLQLERISYD